MKLSTMKKIMNSYNNKKSSVKDITLTKLPTQTNQLSKKNGKNNIKKSMMEKRKKNYIELKKLKKLNSHSRSKIGKNNQYYRNKLKIHPNQYLNKTISSGENGNIAIIDDIHDRNLSTPYLKRKKDDEINMNNNYLYKNADENNNNNYNIVKINLRNRKSSDDQDNYEQSDFNSLDSIKDSHDNSTLLTYNNDNNDEQMEPTIFYRPKNINGNNPLMRKTLGEEDNNYIHKNILNFNNFYKNINNNKKLKHKNKTKLDLSTYNKNIETIKNKREMIALLKEQLKMKDNNYNKSKDKPKLNKTINTSNAINLDQINNKLLNKKNVNKSYKSKKNIKKNNNNVGNDSNTLSKDLTPRQAFTARENSNINLSNSSNKKTATISTNVTNNNNGFGNSINIFNVCDGQNDKDKKELKDNINSNKKMNNNNLNNINRLDNDKTRNKNNEVEEKNYTKEDEINHQKNQLDNNIKNNDFSNNDNNINNNNKNNNDQNKKQNYIYLQRSSKTNDSNYLTKTINPLNIKNKNKSNMNDKNRSRSRSKEKEKKIHHIKKTNKRNHIYENHYNNKINERNSFNNKYNLINSERYSYFNDVHNNNKNEENNQKNNISSDNMIKRSEDISQKENDFDSLKRANSYSKKIISHKTKYTRNKSAERGSNEKIDISNQSKKHFTNSDFKKNSIYKIGVICRAGEIVFGQKKINQDNYFDCLINDDMRFIGVCDGHGDHGEHVSQFLRENLPKELEKTFNNVFKREDNKINLLKKEMSVLSDNTENLEINEKSENKDKNDKNNNIFEIIKGVFEKTFLKTDKNLSLFCQSLNHRNTIPLKDDESIFNVEYSGSTCASILLKEENINKIYIANVGDSRAILIKEPKNKNNDWISYQLTRDHKPSEQDEAQRVLEYDGEIEKIQDQHGNWTGPLRVWVKGSDGPGLAMTRSFGDEVAATVGVFSVPEVTEYKIKEEDRAIIIASDGLWEFMDNKSVTDIVKSLIKQKNPDIIVNKLLKESINQWKLFDQGIDDITIICILLTSS